MLSALLPPDDTASPCLSVEQRHSGEAQCVTDLVSHHPLDLAIRRWLDEADVPVCFDVNLRPTVWSDPADAVGLCESVASNSTIVKLSLDDAFGLFGSGVDSEAVCARILALGAPTVVLTDGARGCWFANATTDEIHFIPAYRVEAVEPTGAGDAFAAAIIARAIASGWKPLQREDVLFASAAGALATTKRGAWDGLPTPDQLEAFLAQ